MKTVRLVLHATALLLHLWLGILILVSVFWMLTLAQRRCMVRWWSGIALRICHTRTVVRGTPPASRQGVMVVCNHISWLDIPILNSRVALRFVAKSEIRRWPLVGLICARTETIFIRRGLRHAVHEVMHYLKDVLQSGGQVGVFPEGTTSAGDGLLPFHANLLQAVLEAGVPIVPVALRYTDRAGRPSQVAAYVGDMTIGDSLRQVLSAKHIVAEITFLAPIYPTPEMSRHDLARLAQAAIAQSLGFALPHS